MTRYVFEVVRNGQRLGDASVDLDSLSKMRREALNALHDIAIDEMAASDLDESLTVSVYDEAGKRVYSTTLTVSPSLAFDRQWGSAAGE